jgi:enamine deaminase RidA (YjgF/YER057c/UK114 family)
MIASGVGIGANTAIYKTSGLGPSALNTAAPAGSEASYIDTAVFPGGTLPAGVTITEAQGINVLRRIGENLQAAGLSYDDVHTMRVFLQNPAGATTADFAGWNRAYRQYFANTDLTTGKFVPVPLGTAAPAKPFVVNKARPSRFALEIENLPVTGWLVEVEVDAAYGMRS